LLTYDAASSPLAAQGGSAARSHAFTLPDGTAGAGTLSITLTTDANNDVVEGFSGSTPENNNATTAAVVSRLRPYPDLVVNGLSVNPTTVLTGQTVTVSWLIENSGTDAVRGAFSDRVRVVNASSGVVLVNQLLPYDPAGDGEIGVGQGRDRSLTITIPDGSGSVGNLTVSVTTDREVRSSSTTLGEPGKPTTRPRPP
jgi:hypothetical protein